MSTADFFEKTLDDGPPRDRYGRPMLFPRGHDPACPECAGKDSLFQPHRRWYTRSSSLSDMLADFGHIQKWRMRYLARSMGYNRDLAMLAAAGALVGAAWGGAVLRSLLLPDVEWRTPVLDLRLALFTVGIAVAAGLIAAIVPAVQSGRQVYVSKP